MKNKALTISIRSHFSLEDIKGLLDSASHGARYWSDSEKLGYESIVSNVLLPKIKGKNIAIKDYENEPMAYLINIEKIKRGLTVMAKKQPHDFADILKGEYDNNTGDIFLQCCLFGEVIYG